jgi:hypothetical protein
VPAGDTQAFREASARAAVSAWRATAIAREQASLGHPPGGRAAAAYCVAGLAHRLFTLAPYFGNLRRRPPPRLLPPSLPCTSNFLRATGVFARRLHALGRARRALGAGLGNRRRAAAAAPGCCQTPHAVARRSHAPRSLSRARLRGGVSVRASLKVFRVRLRNLWTAWPGGCLPGRVCGAARPRSAAAAAQRPRGPARDRFCRSTAAGKQLLN